MERLDDGCFDERWREAVEHLKRTFQRRCGKQKEWSVCWCKACVGGVLGFEVLLNISSGDRMAAILTTTSPFFVEVGEA